MLHSQDVKPYVRYKIDHQFRKEAYCSIYNHCTPIILTLLYTLYSCNSIFLYMERAKISNTASPVGMRGEPLLSAIILPETDHGLSLLWLTQCLVTDITVAN